MGRPPIGKKAMTPAERQKRRRKAAAKSETVEQRKGRRARVQAGIDKAYIPTPPGITYWEHVAVKQNDGTDTLIWAPKTRPLASCHLDLSDDDLRALLDALQKEATRRGLK